jgi:hypothetical protein
VLAERYWPDGRQPQTPAPMPSPAGGAFGQPIEVSVPEPVAGASIAYTFDTGANPRWLLYSAPITVAASGTLRLRAVRYGWAESAESVACFTLAGADPMCP